MHPVRKEHTILTILSAVILLPFLGSVHLFDWDEINFAESAREMLVTGDWLRVQINFETFWEKPPLFMWLQAICMKIFGVNEFAARLPNAIAGIITLNLIYGIARRRSGRKLAIWWVLLYVGSLTPLIYFKSGIIDPVFNLFIFLSCYRILLSLEENHRSGHSILAGIFLGVAVLTKGPVAILIVVLFTLFIALARRRIMDSAGLHFPGWGAVFATFLTALLTSLLWYVPLILVDGVAFIPAFISYQLDLLLNPVASHGQPWFYHALILLLFCFPAAVIALPRMFRSKETDSFDLAMVVLFWVVLILFSAVTTKIVHYSSLCYLPLTYLGARYLNRMKDQPRWNAILLLVIGTLLAAVITAMPLIGMGEIPLTDVKDKILHASLDQSGIWKGWEIVFGLLMFAVVILLFNALWRKKQRLALIGLCMSAFTISAVMTVIVPKVERHTQHGIIEYYRTNTNAVFHTYKFKSYAHYFYGKVSPLEENDALSVLRRSYYHSQYVDGPINLSDEQRRELSGLEFDMLTSGTYHKPVRIICRVNKAKELRAMDHLLELKPEDISLGSYCVFIPK